MEARAAMRRLGQAFIPESLVEAALRRQGCDVEGLLAVVSRPGEGKASKCMARQRVKVRAGDYGT